MRPSADFVADKRRHKQNTILLTGGSGLLSSHMAVIAWILLCPGARFVTD